MSSNVNKITQWATIESAFCKNSVLDFFVINLDILSLKSK